MLAFLQKLARCTSGTAFIEATLILPLAVSLMVGGVEFGRILADYSTVGKSVRDAARYLSQLPSTTDICGWGLTNAQNLAVYGEINPPSGAQPLISGWTTDTVNVAECTSGFDATTPVITVTAAVPYTVSMLGAIGLPDSYSLTSQHQERFIGQ